MKYCTKCGNELNDLAVICTKCGCMVEQQARRTAQTSMSEESNLSSQTKSDSHKPSTLSVVFNFVFDLLAAFSLLWLGIAIATMWISNVGTGAYYIRFDEGLVVFAMLSAFATFVPAVVSFVCTLVNRDGLKYILAAIKRWVISFLLIIVTICFVAYC